MSKRQYSDNDKAAALAFLDFNKGNVQRSAKALGIPNSTLDEWVKGRNQNAEVSDLRNDKKVDISTLIDAAVRDMVSASEGKLSTANFQQLWTGVGIAVDKMQILKGEPSSITKDVTKHSNEERVDRILRLVKPAKAGRA